MRKFAEEITKNHTLKNMNKYLIILVVCLVFGIVSQPVDRLIKRKVPSKWMALGLRFVAYWIILVALYEIAALLGFSLWD